MADKQYKITFDLSDGTEKSVEFTAPQGEPGYTPQKGVDYFDGVDGKDGQDGADGYTPVKGVDYFDGAPGKDGKDGNPGADGYTPVKGVDYWTDTDKTEMVEDVLAEVASNETLIDNIADAVKMEVPLVKTAEQPEFVSGTGEMTDPAKVYVMPDGYLYAYTEVENYNLLKISEVEYSSRLQDGVAGTASSTTTNAVTGWIPVKYGKFYTMSALYGGARVAGSAKGNSFFTRMNVKLIDGTIVTYDKLTVPNALVSSKQTMYLEQENAVAVRLHFNIAAQDISSATKLKAFEPMIVEGDTADEAYNNALTFAYLDGDAEAVSKWVNTGLAYNQPADYEDRVVELEKDVSDLKTTVEDLENRAENPASASPYYRNANFGVLPFTYYKGLSNSYESAGFHQNTKYADFITAWKTLVTNHSGYVTETELGKTSDGQSIYLYDFKPVQITNQKKPIPKIIIVAGQHGFEKSNVFGLYHFVENLLNRWNQHPALEYLRNHAELMIVPVLNTYGFDTLEYKNANGVNTNRNFDSHWEVVSDTTSSNYGGATPFDQPETQIVRDLVQNNKDAVMVIDFHTNGMSSVATYQGITWYGVCVSTDDYYNRMLDAVAHHLSAISANFNLDYELNQPNTMMGFLHNGDGTGLLRNWVTDNNIAGVLVEGFNGFPNKARYTPEVFKANEEIVVNYLITALNYLAK